MFALGTSLCVALSLFVRSILYFAMPDSPRRSQSSTGGNNPVVASLAKKSPHPFSSLALSPTRQHAVTACKDTLQIVKVGPFGITPQKTIPIAQHFQTAVGSDGRPVGHMGRIYEDVRDSFVRDAFGLGHRNSPSTHHQPNTFTNIVVTDVAWSIPQRLSSSDEEYERRGGKKESSLIAAAGSNGVIVVWTADTLLGGGPGHPPAPEAVLSQHARAVNRLAWHPTRSGLLLSASQDGTVLLWERGRTSGKEKQTKKRNERFSLFAGAPSASKVSYTWQCKTSFEPKSEAVRDIRWSPFYEDGTREFSLFENKSTICCYIFFVSHILSCIIISVCFGHFKWIFDCLQYALEGTGSGQNDGALGRSYHARLASYPTGCRRHGRSGRSLCQDLGSGELYQYEKRRK